MCATWGTDVELRILELPGPTGDLCEVSTRGPSIAVAHVLTLDSIGTSDDELGRMLEVLKFWFTKDLVLLDLRHVHEPE